MKNSNLTKNQLSSFFDLNIPRKINYNNSFNRASTEYQSNENNNKLIINKFKKVSKFNPYDVELLNRNIDKKSQNGEKSYFNKYKNLILLENKENDSRQSNLLIKKENKYLDINHKYEQNLMNKFNTPNTGLNLGNNKKNIPEYSIKIKNQKNQYFNDLKNGLKNLKIKTTNYSSNGSYNMTEIIETSNKDIKIKDSSFNNKINIIFNYFKVF